MVKHLLLVLALALGSSGVTLVVTTANAVAAPKKAKKAGKKKARAKRPGGGNTASAADPDDTVADAEEAQAEAEERRAPASFAWTPQPTEADMDARADEKRDESIDKLKKLLPTVPDGEQKAELIFRLSEMYWGKSKFLHLRAMRQWDEQLDLWHDKGEKGPQPKLETLADNDKADLFKREALKLYEQLLEKYPNYPRKDEVLYNLGSSLYESGDKQKGVEMYWKLIKQFPDSSFSPDAWLQLGEHFFNANKLPQAIKAYTKAAETKKPRVFSYAQYKLAWCDYNLQDYDKSLEKFRDVIAYAKKQAAADAQKGGLDKKDKIQLVDEALSDMVRVYSHIDAIEGAFEFYATEVGKDRAYRYLRKLSKLYNSEGKHDLEIKTYEKLNTDYPYAPEAPENHTAIMNAYAQLGRSKEVRREVRRMIDLYSPNAVWAQHNAGNKEILEKAFDTVEQELSNLVTEKHKEAQQTKLVDTYKLARDIYKEYLDKFTKTENSYKFRFFYAEILFELKEFEDAGVEYGKVVAENAKGEFVKPAAYTAILAWEKVYSGVKEEVGKKIEEKKGTKSKGALAKLEKLEDLQKGKKYEAEPLTDPERKLADACDKFVDIAPEDDEVVKVKFKSARLFYVRNQFEEAAKRFGEIIDRWPKDKMAHLAAESILQSFNVREDWSQLNAWGRKFTKHDLLMSDAAFKKRVDEFVEGASFNEIHFVFEPKATPLEIADHYAGFVKEFPKSKYVMVGLYNAVVNYDKSNFLEKSMQYAEMTIKDYKDFKISDKDAADSKREGAALPEVEDIREKVMFLLATFNGRLAEFDVAADWYEKYASEFPKGDKRPDALFNSGLLREGLGEYDTAMKSFQAYIKDYPKAKDTPDVAWRIGLILLDRKKDYKAAVAHFSQFSKIAGVSNPGRDVCADYKVVLALGKQNKDKEVKAGYDAILKAYPKLSAEDKAKPCPLEAAAAAAFYQVEPTFQTYLALSLTGNEKELAQRLVKKTEMIAELQKKYTDVLGIGQGDYGIASLFRIGVVYQNASQAIFGIPCPRRFDEDQCGIFQSELQSKGFPLEEKAIEAFDKALNKAYELGIYNDWLAKTQDAMKQYEPQRFPEIREYDLIASEKVFDVPALVEVQP
ncbi:MAG: tetratricopeptide repeat protein [Deltaproteobacteria bacterium]|nr:tetratricopeptide repeat protein [Deltaproteobacteria bacterium]